MTDTDFYIQMMAAMNPLLEPTVCSVIQALPIVSGSSGLDAGCGIGLQARLLAEAVGSAGHVTGVDISSEFLLRAEESVKNSGLFERISFRQGDVSRLPFEENTFDWAWSSDCVGYSPYLDPWLSLKELARVVKPGGLVAIFAWSSESLIPGYPLLEARLEGTSSGMAPFGKEKRPEVHFLRALGWFREGCFSETTAQTFVGDVHAPLTDDFRRALTALFAMRWSGVDSELTPEEWADYQRLCLPESPDFIVNHPDYYAFFTCSMFHGRVSR